ncbi:MAG: hypothetical protein ACTTH5_03065 [Wolinella sp.]
MKIKTLTLIWALLSLIIGLYVYNINQDIYTYAPPLGTHSWSFPVAIWVILPMTLLFMLVLFGSLKAKIKEYLKSHHHKHDFELLIHQLFAQAAKKEFQGTFKTPYFSQISKILHRFSLDIEPHTALSDSPEIDGLIEAHSKIYAGEVVELKRFNLPYNAPLNIQNQLNRLKNNEPKIAGEILRKGDAPNSLKKAALLVLFKNSEEKEFRRYQNSVATDIAWARELLNVYDGTQKFSTEEIAQLGIAASYTPQEYLSLARKLKGMLEPDAWLKLFENIANRTDKAEESYLYALLNLEMISAVQERLNAHTMEDFKKVRAFLELRKVAGANYPAEIFFF